MNRGDNEMSIDTTAMDYADDTFIRSMRALDSMQLADLPPELDQDARDIARVIQEHGPDYANTEYGDMTAPLLESLARLVEAASLAQHMTHAPRERAAVGGAEHGRWEQPAMSTDIDTKELRNYVSTAWFLWGNDAYDRLLDDAGAAAVALGLDFSEVPMNAERPLTAKVGEVMDRIAALEDQAAMGRATQRYLDELGALLKPGEDQDYKERAREVMDRLAALEAELASAREAERVQRVRAERERDRAHLYRNAVPESADYVDALDHIMRAARRSRTQSRRLRWIEARARCALEGGEDWKELDLPRFSESNQRYLKARIAELEEALAAGGDQ